MNARSFEEYVTSGVIKKITPDKARARSLMKEVEEKKEFLELVLKKLEQKEVSPNFVVDSCYDLLI